MAASGAGIFVLILPLLILGLLIGGGILLAIMLSRGSKPCPHCGATKETWKTASQAAPNSPKCPACGIPLQA